MSVESIKPKVVILVGPTAVGKTELSIRLAEALNGEIVSADSRLLYRGMDIGTAKPSKEEMERVPHHLINLAEPDEVWSLSIFQSKLVQTLHEIHERGNLPIVAGGTGQYIRSLMEGWTIPTVAPNPKLREILEEMGERNGALELHRRLQFIDPAAAMKIDANNVRRSIRALEVILTTGELFSTQKEKRPSKFTFKVIGLIRPREELYSRVDERIAKMFERGLVNEVKILLEHGFSEDLPTLSAIGYREVIQCLHGDCTLEEVKNQMRKKTREFIRRQTNWFKPDNSLIEWHAMTPDPFDKIVESIKADFLDLP